MSRINYREDEAYAGEFHLWRANCDRSIQGKRGQQELMALRDALLAMPNKRLIQEQLINEDGEFCAIGVYAKHKGIDLSKYHSAYGTISAGIKAGMPSMVARSVVVKNDLDICGMFSPEDRYRLMLDWVTCMIRTAPVPAPALLLPRLP